MRKSGFAVGVLAFPSQAIIIKSYTPIIWKWKEPIVIDDSSWKNAAESFTVPVTLTLGGYESAIAPNNLTTNKDLTM